MLNEEIGNQLAGFLQQKYGFATVTQLDKSMSDLLKRAEKRAAGGPTLSLTTLIRGLKAQRGEPINEGTKTADLEYVRALNTGSTPGSFLVPTIQPGEAIGMLSLGGVARAAGARVWDLAGIQKVTVPSATTSPTWAWAGQNTSTTASDANLGQLSFDLKEARALTIIPNALLKSSVPAFDQLLADMLAASGAEFEDAAIFATTTATGFPAALYATCTTSTLLVGGSVSGGNLAYTDVTATMAKAAAAKAKGPFAWFMSPRSWYTRCLGLVDTTSRPIVVQSVIQGAQNLGQAAAGMLMGFPVFVTPAILENLSNGSGSSQSWIALANPKYLHIAQGGTMEIVLSTERYFELNQTGVRATAMIDAGYSPEPGVTILKGVN